MNDLLSDLLHDLRQKRLLPVAIALLVGIVAIPVVLRESAAEPPAPESAATVADVAKDSPLELDVDDAESSPKGSALDVLSERNPFKPPTAVTASKAQATSATAGASDPAGAGGQGGQGGQPSDPGSSGGNGGGGGGQAPAPAAPKTVEYEYVADVTFWNGDRRHERRLHKLDMLPNQDTPILIFMGVTANGGDAIFLVDSSLETTGEGSCQPSRSNCTFVNLGAGAEHLFTTESGKSYRLRVDEIRRVKLSAGMSSRSSSAETASGSKVSRRPFDLPTFADAIEETGPADGTSSSPDSDGR